MAHSYAPRGAVHGSTAKLRVRCVEHLRRVGAVREIDQWRDHMRQHTICVCRHLAKMQTYKQQHERCVENQPQLSQSGLKLRYVAHLAKVVQSGRLAHKKVQLSLA